MPWSVVVPDGADENVVEATVRELEAAGLDPVLVAGAAQAVPSHADDDCVLVTAGTAAVVGAVEGLLAARARHPVRAVRALATTAEGTITVDLVDGELGAAALAAGSAAAVLDAFGDSRITTWWVDGSELGLGAYADPPSAAAPSATQATSTAATSTAATSTAAGSTAAGPAASTARRVRRALRSRLPRVASVLRRVRSRARGVAGTVTPTAAAIPGGAGAKADLRPWP